MRCIELHPKHLQHPDGKAGQSDRLRPARRTLPGQGQRPVCVYRCQWGWRAEWGRSWLDKFVHDSINTFKFDSDRQSDFIESADKLEEELLKFGQELVKHLDERGRSKVSRREIENFLPYFCCKILELEFLCSEITAEMCEKYKKKG